MKRLKYRKYLVRHSSKFISKNYKIDLLHTDNTNGYFYGKSKRISKLLIGKCCIFEGIEPIGWYPNPNDLIIIIENNLSRKDIRFYNRISYSVGKEPFYSFHWGPHGLSEIALAAIYFTVEQAAGYIFQKVLDTIFNKQSNLIINNIRITPKDNNSFNLFIYDQHNKQYCFIINIENGNNNYINQLFKELNKRTESIILYDAKGVKSEYKDHYSIINILS